MQKAEPIKEDFFSADNIGSALVCAIERVEWFCDCLEQSEISPTSVTPV